jgi:hypothetical protein
MLYNNYDYTVMRAIDSKICGMGKKDPTYMLLNVTKMTYPSN